MPSTGIVDGFAGTWNVAVEATSSVASDSLAVLMNSVKRRMMSLFASVTIVLFLLVAEGGARSAEADRRSPGRCSSR